MMTYQNSFVAKEASGEILWEKKLPDMDATEHLARAIAQELRPGDLVILSGDLGAGKTALVRAILRFLAQDSSLEVPSPTFTIIQHYDFFDKSIIHADFYRLGGPSDLMELDWEDLTENKVTLVEWPDRAISELNPNRLEILIDFMITGERIAYLLGRGSFKQRLVTMTSIDNLLHQSYWAQATRIPLAADASHRYYERLQSDDNKTAMLMIAPPRPDGPPVRRGRPYTTLAKLSKTVHPFVAIAQGLSALGLSAPRLYLKDLDRGLLVLEDLGSEGISQNGKPISERYQEAVHVLTKLHRASLPHNLPVTQNTEYSLPIYDLEAMMIEAELFLDWYIPSIRGNDVSGSARSEFGHLWSDLLKPVLQEPTTWTLRDYHSPNLFWIPDRQGIKRIGIIDFQDAVLGPPSYDLVSLLQDARITVPPELELKLLAYYGCERKKSDHNFDLSQFATTYAIMGAQRATKILGIFIRLNKRDGKAHYLHHIPRLEHYLVRNLSHPALAKLQRWYLDNLPHLFG